MAGEDTVRVEITADDKTGGAFASADAKAKAFQRSIDGTNRQLDKNQSLLRQAAYAEMYMSKEADKATQVQKDLDTALGRTGGRVHSLMSEVGKFSLKGLENTGKGIGAGGGIFAAGAGVLGMASPLAAATLAMGAFGAVAYPTLTKVSAASNALQAAQLRYAQATTTAGRTAAKNAEQAAIQNNNLTKQQVAMIGPVNQLQNAWGQLQNKAVPGLTAMLKIGISLMPVFGSLVKAGGQVLQAFAAPLEKLVASPFWKQFQEEIVKLGAQMATVLGPVLVQVIRLLMQLFVQTGPAGVKILALLLPLILRLAMDLVPVIAWVTKLTAAILDWLQKTHLLLPVLALAAIAVLAIGGPIFATVAAIVVLIAVGVELARNWRKIWADIKQWTDDAVNWVKDHLRLLYDEWKIEWILISTAVKVVWDLIRGIVKIAWDYVSGIIKVGLDLLQGHWSQAWHDFLATIQSVWDDIRNVVMTVIHDIEGAIGGLVSTISNIGSTIGHIGGSLLHGIGLAGGGIVGAAVGGVRGNLTLVGERGPELVRLAAGSRVYNNAQTRGMLAAGAGGGGRVYNINVSVMAASPQQTGRTIVEYIREFERQSGHRWRS